MAKASLYCIGNQCRKLKPWREIFGNTMPSDSAIYARVNEKGMSFIEAITWVKPQQVYIGEVYGYLEVTSNPYKLEGKNYYVCDALCKCGKSTTVTTSHLKQTKYPTQSCGCKSAEELGERSKTHGLSQHPLYNVWTGMNARCNNPNNIGYSDYGAKGVYVSDDWNESNPEGLENFFSDMEATYKPGYVLDKDIRAIPGKPKCYSKDTCVWVTPAVNARNTSSTKFTPSQIKVIKQRLAKGETCKAIARDYGVCRSTINRIKNGKSWKNI